MKAKYQFYEIVRVIRNDPEVENLMGQQGAILGMSQDEHGVWRTIQRRWPRPSLQNQLPHRVGAPDVEARNRTKRETNWRGYAAHLTETCQPTEPHLITNVVTTPATTLVLGNEDVRI